MKQEIQLSDHFSYSKLIKFILPSVGMMIFTSIYGVVDGLFVSNFVGKTPFAAINLVYPLIMILGGFGFMMGTAMVFVALLLKLHFLLAIYRTAFNSCIPTKIPDFSGIFSIKNALLPPFLPKKLSDFLKPPLNLPFRAFSRLREGQAKLGGA